MIDKLSDTRKRFGMKEGTRGLEMLATLYATARDTDPWSCPAGVARGMLGGFLAVYDATRVEPGLKAVFGSPGEALEPVHGWTGRLREEVAREGLGVEKRVEYAAEMLGAYRLLSGRGLVERGLEVAWEVTGGSAEGRLPCKGAGMCRLLQECFFFTGERGYGMRAGELLREGTGGTTSVTREELLAWWDAVEVQKGIAGELGEEVEGGYTAAFWHGERERWLPVVERVEEAMLAEWEPRENRDIAGSLEGVSEGSERVAGLARAFGAAGRRAWREVVEDRRIHSREW